LHAVNFFQNSTDVHLHPSVTHFTERSNVAPSFLRKGKIYRRDREIVSSKVSANPKSQALSIIEPLVEPSFTCQFNSRASGVSRPLGRVGSFASSFSASRSLQNNMSGASILNLA
jgi:hypothetical protein